MNEQPCRRLRVFISQPMNGKTNEEIEKERDELIEFAKEKLGSDVEIIDSFFKDAPHDAKPLWFLGKSFELLSTADAAIFVDLLKRAVNETPDGRLELRSMEIILNDYFHAKQSADDTQFKVNADYKKLKALEIIDKKNVNVALLKTSDSVGSYHYKMDERRTPVRGLTQDEFDLLKEVLKQ